MDGRRLAGLLFALLALFLPAPAQAAVVDDDPSIAAQGVGDMRLFVRGTDGALWTRSWNGTSWSGWSSLGGVLTSGPTAIARPGGVYDVYVRGGDEAYYHKYFTPSGGWVTTWEKLTAARFASAPGATYRQGTGEIDVVGVGYDNQLYHGYWASGQGWSQWGALGGSVRGRPSAISPAPSILDIYLRGGDGQLFQKYWTSSTGWGDFIPLGGALSSGIAATSWEYARRDIFARGGDNAIYDRAYQTDAWAPWARIGGYLTSGPGAAATAPGQLSVVARAGDQIVINSYASGWSGWSGWQSLGRAPLWPDPTPPAPAPDAELRLRAGLACVPRGGRVPVRVRVMRRAGRKKPRVLKVVFSVDRGKLRRTDRKRPYRASIRVRFKSGTKHRVHARIHYRRAGSKQVRRKTVSKRFSMCR